MKEVNQMDVKVVLKMAMKGCISGTRIMDIVSIFPNDWQEAIAARLNTGLLVCLPIEEDSELEVIT